MTSTVLALLPAPAKATLGLRIAREMRTRDIDLAIAQVAGSPDNLLRVAREHSSQGAVGELATLAAADAFLNAGWSGVAPGGDPANADDLLNDEQRRANYARAKELYERYLTLRPAEPGVLTDLGVSLRGLGQFQEAMARFEEAQKLESDHWQSLYNEVVVLAFDLKDMPKAQAVLRRLRQLQPDNPEVTRLAEEVARRGGSA